MKKNNKKLPHFVLGTMGYLRPKGIGDSTFNSKPGIHIGPEISAMRRNYAPIFLNGIQLNAQLPLQTMKNTTIFPEVTSKFTLAGINTPMTITPTRIATNAPLTGAGINGSSYFTTNSLRDIAGSATGNQLTLGSTTISPTAAAKDVLLTLSPAKSVLNTTGKVLGAIGAAQGAYGMYSDIANAGDHRTAQDMADTVSLNEYTTAGGNRYTTYGGPDLNAELAYGKQLAKNTRASFASNAGGFLGGIGGILGPSIGLSSWGGPIGLAAGTVLGLLGGALFGLGDNSEEIEKEANLLADTNSRRSLMNLSVAESKDYERAANGRLPKFNRGKANARVSKGEIVGNFEDGYFRVPGAKDNKDSVKTHLNKEDYVISNKHGLSDYAWSTGDIPGALAALLYLQKTGQMNKYKNGRLPKFAEGKDFISRLGEYGLATLPHFGSYLSNLAMYNRAKHADTYAPDVYSDNPEGSAAVNELANLRYDINPTLRDIERQAKLANWIARRNVGLGIGGRAIAQNANLQAANNAILEARAHENEANAKYSTIYAQALQQLGAMNQQRRLTAAAQRAQQQQQAYGARWNNMAQYNQNMVMAGLNGAADLLRMGQYDNALDILNRMLRIYERQADLDWQKYIDSKEGMKGKSPSWMFPDYKFNTELKPALSTSQNLGGSLVDPSKLFRSLQLPYTRLPYNLLKYNILK